MALLAALLGAASVLLLAGLGWLVLQAPLDLVNRALPSGLVLTVDHGGDADIQWGMTTTVRIERGALRDTAGLPVAQVERLMVAIDLPRLLDGVIYVRDAEFRRGGADVDAILAALGDETSPEDSDAAGDPEPGLAILIAHLALDDIVIDLPGIPENEAGNLVFEQFDIDADPANPDRLRVRGDIAILGRDLAVSGTLGHPAGLFEPAADPLPIQLAVASGADMLEIDGHLSNGPLGPQIDAMARIDVADLGPVLRDVALPVPDRFGVAGTLRILGPVGSPALRDIVLVAGNGQDLVLDVAGEVADPFGLAGLDVAASLDLPDSFDLSTILPIPATLGRGTLVELDARVTGARRSIDVSGLTLLVQRAEGELDLTDASLAVSFDQDGSAHLLAAAGDARLAMRDPATLAGAFDLPAPDVDTLVLAGRLGLAADRLSFTVASAEIGIADLALTGQGSASARLTEHGLEPDRFDLTVSGQGSGRTALTQLGLETAPIQAPYTLRGRVTGTAARFTLSDLVLEAGGARGLSIVLRGAISDLTTELDMAGARADLLLNASAPDLTSFGRLAGLDLPRFGPTRLEANLRGPANAPEIGHVRMIAGDPEGGSWMLAFGRIARIALAEGESPSGVDLTMLGAVRDIETLRGLLPPDLAQLPPPEVTPLHLQAVLGDADGSLGLDNLIVIAGDQYGPEPSLQMDGSVGNLAGLSDIALSGWLELDLNRVALVGTADTAASPQQAADPTPVSLASLPVRGRFTVTDETGRPSLSMLELETLPGAVESLSVEATMADVARAETLSGRIVYAAPDPARLNAKSGLSLPADLPLQADLSFRPLGGSVGATGQITLGSSDAALDLTFDPDAVRPRLAGTISSALVRLSDLGLEAELTPEEQEQREQSEQRDSSEPQAAPPPAPSPALPARTRDIAVFPDDPLDLSSLRRVDLAVEHRIARLEGREFVLRDGYARVGLEDGRLALEDMRATYEGGRGTAALLIDTSNGPTSLELDLRIDDMHLERLLAQVTDRATITGLSDITVSLRSQGDSPLALARGLSGDITLAIGQGSINTSRARLLTQNLLGWLFTGGALSGNVRMDCAMLRANVQAGVASFDRLAVVLEDTVALGEGTVDIPQGWLDLTLVPRSRRGIGGTPTPIAARGPWEAPSVGPSGGAIPLKLAGDVLLAPLQLLSTLLPFIGGEAEHPCTGLGNPG